MSASQARGNLAWPQPAVDAAVLLGCFFLLLHYFPPDLLFLDTITTGGDTGSHFITADYLARHLLPQGRVVGWFPANLAGYPLFQFYFPLPFLVMAGLSYLGLNLTIAFKLVSAFGAFIMPLGAYLGLRLAGRPFPAPALAAAFSLLFLCNETNSMWGGNILSLLAGEIGYSIGLGLLLIYLGAMQGDIAARRHLVRNAILLTLVGLAHGCTLLFGVLAGVVWLFHRDVVARGVYVFKVYALAFCLMGFWIVPLIIFAPYNSTHNMVWIIERWQEVVPPILMPPMALCLIHLGWGLWRRRRGLPGLGGAGLMLGWVALSLALFLVAYHLNVIDIRFFPFAWLALAVWAALAVDDLSRALAGRIFVPVLVLVLALLWVDHWVKFIPNWAQWNYRGYELAPGWADFKRLNDYLRGTAADPRVLHEHADVHQRLGTSRAFENLFLFAGRATMEGLYIQSSLNSPYVFYIQSQTSQTPTTPLPGINYSRFDLAAAHPRLTLYNIGQFVAVSEKTIAAAQATPGYRLEKQIGPYHVFRVEGNPGRYVEPLRFKPVKVLGGDWKEQAFQWFRRGDFAAPLVFGREEPGDRLRFAAVLDRAPAALPRAPLPAPAPLSEKVGLDRIEIETSGRNPLLVKMSYHPNWLVEGGRAYPASPAFLVVYPEADRVVLRFGLTWPNHLGQALTVLACLCLLASLPGVRGLAPARAARALAGAPFEAATRRLELWSARPLAFLGRHAVSFGLAGALALAGLLAIYLHAGGKVDSAIAFHRGLDFYRAKDYAGAEPWFRYSATKWPHSPVIGQVMNHWALCHYLRQQYPEAITIYRRLALEYPEDPVTPEAIYHIGQSYRHLRHWEPALAAYREVMARFPQTAWAGYAKDRVNDINNELKKP
ncbi:MAG: 6-pyruvoyl-tetrahydropterin synthase-related protein [Thermodesulfobacteriota bacterium]